MGGIKIHKNQFLLFYPCNLQLALLTPILCLTDTWDTKGQHNKSIDVKLLNYTALEFHTSFFTVCSFESPKDYIQIPWLLNKNPLSQVCHRDDNEFGYEIPWMKCFLLFSLPGMRGWRFFAAPDRWVSCSIPDNLWCQVKKLQRTDLRAGWKHHTELKGLP